MILDWSHATVKMYELDTTEEQAIAANAAAREFRDYVVELIGERRRAPREDLVSALVEARVDGGRLTDAEIVSTVIVLLNAGHEATVNTLGNGVRALMHHREQWQRLVDASVPSAAAIEELIRYDPPLQLFERWVLEDSEVCGVRVPKGAELGLMFGSSNRDPEVFADPDRLDLARDPNPHISFGAGIHFCLGAPLARLEMQIAFETILRRMPRLQLLQEPEWKPTYIIRGLKSLPVRA